jgi:hypothetical protein
VKVENKMAASWGSFLDAALFRVRIGGGRPESGRYTRRCAAPAITKQFHVIFQYKAAAGDGQHDKIRRAGGWLKQHPGSLNAAAYELSGNALRELDGDAAVEFAAPDHERHGAGDHGRPVWQSGSALNSHYACFNSAQLPPVSR